MINFKTNFLGLALAGLILGACSQTGTYETADLMNEQAVANKAGFTLTPFGTGNANASMDNCGTACITDTSGDEFATTDSATESFGGKNNNNDTKTLSVKVWNTLTTIEYRFTLTTTANQAGNLQFFDEVSQSWINAGSFTNGVEKAVSRPLADGWKKCDLVTEQWRQTGGGAPAELGDVSYALIGICTTASISSSVNAPVCENETVTLTASVTSFGNFTGGTIQIVDSENMVVASQAVTADDKDVTYSVPTGNEGSFTYLARYLGAGSNGYNDDDSETITVVVEECNDCDGPTFSYDTEDNLNITFTYNHDKVVENVTLVFTFPQVLDLPLNDNGDYVAPDGKIYEVNNPTNQTNFTWTGSVSCKALQAETFEFSMSPDCGAGNANDGQANIWTDATITAENGVKLVDDLSTPKNEGAYSLKGTLKGIVFEGCPSKK